MEITTYSTKQTKDLAKQIADQTKKGDIIALYGEMGSGKTTFTRYLVELLGIGSRVQSPTYVLHRIYQKDDLKINHFDLYKLKSKSELEDIYFEEALNEQDSICIIEWPQISEYILQKYDDRVKKIYIEYIQDEQRHFVIK